MAGLRAGMRDMLERVANAGKDLEFGGHSDPDDLTLAAFMIDQGLLEGEVARNLKREIVSARVTGVTSQGRDLVDDRGNVNFPPSSRGAAVPLKWRSMGHSGIPQASTARPRASGSAWKLVLAGLAGSAITLAALWLAGVFDPDEYEPPSSLAGEDSLR